MTARPLDTFFTRRSCSQFLDEPIGRDDLQRILRAATTANDHGRLQPWEFHVHEGEGRRRLADAFVRHATLHDPDPRTLEKAASAPWRAPVVVCVATRYQEGKIPRHEQAHSAAAACQLMTLAAHAMSHAATWKTGAWATSATVKQALEIAPHDDIVGFIYLGRPAQPLPTSRDSSDLRIFHHA